MLVALTIIWITAIGAFVCLDRVMNQILSDGKHEELLKSLNSIAKKTN
jgi:type II secretory pathway component PulJ